MADFLGVQQPPTKKFRSGTNSNESDFDFKMLSQFDTPDATNTQDLFGLGNEFNDPMDNTQSLSLTPPTSQQPLATPSNTTVLPSSSTSSSPILNQQSGNIYQGQPRLAYISRAQPTSYQTPNLQRIQTMPASSTIARPANVISNGIQHSTVYTQQLIHPSGGLNRPLFQRMPTTITSQQNAPATLVRQQYNTSGMINMNQNVPQMSIVKTSDPNNNNLFVTNSQQQSTLLGLPQTVTQTPTVQNNKPISTVLPSITSQQLNQYQVQQQQQPQQIHIQQSNAVQSYNASAMRTQMMDQVQPNYLITAQSQQQPQGALNANAPMPNSTPSSNPSNSQQHTEVQRKQFIQKQLVLLLHAHKCQQREKQTINGETTRTNSTCTLPHCSTMKNVLQHMTKCNDHKGCTVPHCVTSRQIIIHWKQCNNPLCPICQPLKTPATLAKGNPSALVSASSAPSANAMLNMASASNATALAERPTTKEWQKRVTSEMRNHLVQKIIAALIPITDPGAVRDKRLMNLARYAQHVESETFEVASNQEEYFHKLAEKIYKIQKELEDRREKKRAQDSQAAGQTTSLPGQPQASNNEYLDKAQLAIETMAGNHGPPNRTAPLTDYASSSGPGNLFQSTHRSEPLIASSKSNRTVLNGANSGGASNSFGITNVPANENLHSLLNGGGPPIVSRSHQDIDMTDLTSRTLFDGTSLKVELPSPRTSAQLAMHATIKREEVVHTDLSHTAPATIKPSDANTADETKPRIAQIDATSKNLPKHPVEFSADELHTRLEPVIQKMIACEDSHPFRQPVDPVALNILDYPSIVKNPMDISTMLDKLLRGEYKNPLQFCDDAWLMFNNAWLYNKKTTRVYKMSSKLSEVFADAIDPVMQTLGYCCGRQHFYFPQVMFCYGNQLCCQIPRDGSYYYYNNSEPSRFNLSGDKYTFCAKCFDSVKNDSIFVGDDPAQTLVELSKSLFLPAKNDIQEHETMVDCIVCSRRWHQVCALHLDQIWPEGFICETCLRDHNIKRKSNRYTAFKLTMTDLARGLEKRVNDFLRNEGCVTGRVTIRILAASDKVCEVKPRLKNYYQNQVPDAYPYRTKAIFAFQEIDGADVVLFGMHVQEYDGRCHAPNTRRVYVSYLDSVHFFRPKVYRTDVYHEILIGYLDYAKQLGYVYAHIWACPPSEGDDYIFHCHPLEQRVPKPRRLQDWYKKMLDRAILERVVIDYKDVMKDCLDNQVQNALTIPYFEGDFWSNIIEESIKELDQEEEERRKKEEVEAARAIEDGGFDDPIEAEDPTDISDKRKSANTHKKKNLKKTTASQRKVAKKQMANCTDLISKVFATMEKHKEAFFVIRLRNPIASHPAVNDTDALIQCDLMDTRDAFLNFARDKHYEFSSMRRAKFSTMALLYELHTSTTDKFTYNCNACRQQCEIRYHCTTCDDFDLCEKCYNTEPKHEHKMERSVPSIVDVSHDGEHHSLNSNDKSLASPQLQRQQSMQRCIEALLHAVNCRNANCVNRSCFRYKRVIQHTKECKGKNSQCNVCKQVIFLCWYHAKTCMEQNCQVPFCTNLKSKIQKQRATSLQTDRRRMQAMMQQRTNTMQTHQQQQQHHSHPQQPSQQVSMSSSSSFDSSGKPAPVTLIRAPTQQQQQQQQPWPNQTYITVAQKPNHGKPTQQTSNQLSLLIGRVKQDPSIDDQQRSDTHDSKQLVYQPFINKTPVNRLPSSSTTFIQPNGSVHSWTTPSSPIQLNPPPSYTTATRPRHPTIIQPQGPTQPSSHTLLAPLRSNTSTPTPPPTYIARTSSTPNLTRAPTSVTILRPSQFSSQQQPPQSQDPSAR